MLVIRPDQHNVFEEAALAKFQEEIVEHLKTFAPELFEIRGEACFREVIQIGIKKAERYGFTNRGPVRFFLETMVAFGSEFDTDPQIPGVSQILSNSDELDQMLHADKLFEVISEFAEKTKGPNNQLTIQAFQRFPHSDLFTQTMPSERLTAALVSHMQNIYPEKARFIGEKR